jgi:membrane protein YqaA with SNARE-associated domain
MVRSLARARWNALLPTIAVVGLSIACLLAPIDTELLERAGYAGVFVVTLVTTGALVLPVPYLAVIARVAMALDPVTVAVIAGVAAAIGELTGYVIGRSGRELLPEGRWLQVTRPWMSRHGFVTVAVAAFIPNPAFDAVGALAGATGYGPWRFCLACFVGKTAKFLIVALAASTMSAS